MTASIQIMLVEDNPDYRNVIEKAIIFTPGMELLSKVGTAEHALRSLQELSNKSAPDVILLDLNLPGMSGLEAIPWVKDYTPHTRIIILTQSENESDIMTAIQHGVSGYLLKSATIQQIKEGIHTAMNGGASLDPSVAQFILSRLQTTPSKPSEKITLTEREFEILSLLSKGHVKKEIAKQLNISFFTVSTHIRHIYVKLQVPNAPAAIAKAYSCGLFSSDI